MQFRAFLEKNNLSANKFAKLMGWSQPSVWNYVHKKAIPTPARIKKIKEVSEGMVTASDFFE